MGRDVTISIAPHHFGELQAALFPGDGKEAVAIVICGQRKGERRHVLASQQVIPVPQHAYVERTAWRAKWRTDWLIEVFADAEAAGAAILKVHSHPTGYPQFSETDDESDGTFFPGIDALLGEDSIHASAVLLPGGRMFGRYWNKRGGFDAVERITVPGDDLKIMLCSDGEESRPFEASCRDAFGDGTMNVLSRLSVGVVGCSGTGSPLVEQLARLGVGTLVLVDDDVVEDRNLNRIYGTTAVDAREKNLKVSVLDNHLSDIGIGTSVVPIPRSLWTQEAIDAVAQCDVVFGCMDTVDGRFLLNRIASYYSIPYIDLGVAIEKRPSGENAGTIDSIDGTIHYVQPGASSLLSRGVIHHDDVFAAIQQRENPERYNELRERGYVRGVKTTRPAVISLNTIIAGLGVQELLARIHGFRHEGNSESASLSIDLRGNQILLRSESDFSKDDELFAAVGKGDRTGLPLDMTGIRS